MGISHCWLNNVTKCFTFFYSSGCRTHEPLAATRRRMNLQSRAESPTEQHGRCFFFSNFHPSSFHCSFFWHSPSKLAQVLSGWWDAGLQLPRLQRLRDHPRARLRQVPTQGEVGETKMSKLWKIYISSTAWKGSGRTTRPRWWSSCGPLTGGSRAW